MAPAGPTCWSRSSSGTIKPILNGQHRVLPGRQVGQLGSAPALDRQRAHAWHHPDQQLYDFVCRGKPGGAGLDMPAFGERLSPEEIRTVIAYFRSPWPEDLRALQAQTTERLALRRAPRSVPSGAGFYGRR